MRLPPDIAGAFERSIRPPEPDPGPGPHPRPAPPRPRRWLSVRRAGAVCASACCDGWDGLIGTLPSLGRGVWHVTEVDSEDVVATLTGRGEWWDIAFYGAST